MKKVALLGTSHDIQREERLSEKFRSMILYELTKDDFASISEEINSGKNYIVERICAEKKISHLIVEPTLDEKCSLNIETEDEINKRIQGVFYDELDDFGDWSLDHGKIKLPPDVWSERNDSLESSYRAREREWLKRLISADMWPSLFICGADHVTPFRKLLESSDIVVEVLCLHWDPEKSE